VALVRVGSRTVKRWVTLKKFPAPIYLNGRPRWHRQVVLDFLADLKSTEAPLPPADPTPAPAPEG
jgi:hypothetical protein